MNRLVGMGHSEGGHIKFGVVLNTGAWRFNHTGGGTQKVRTPFYSLALAMRHGLCRYSMLRVASVAVLIKWTKNIDNMPYIFCIHVS